MYFHTSAGLGQTSVVSRPAGHTTIDLSSGTGLVPLRGQTTPSYYYLRKEPNGQILGELPGQALPVTVRDKSQAGGQIWYQITLEAATTVTRGSTMLQLRSGTQCWTTHQAVIPVAEWDLFFRQLQQFDTNNSNVSLDDRITMLRQMSHESTVPFDPVIGTKKGITYLEMRPFLKSNWQLLKDYQRVQMPDSRDVDIFHLLVGLNVLPRPIEDQVFLGIGIGPNYSAATWSGDIGAAAADATVSQLYRNFDVWTKRHARATKEERLQRYYGTRASEADLLGNVDAWGIHALRDVGTRSLHGLLASYYQDTYSGGQRPLTAGRKDALERFLRHYRFKYSYNQNIKDWPLALANQRGAAQWMAEQIRRFGTVWMMKRITPMNPFHKKFDPDAFYVQRMTLEFLQWLEYQAGENNASVT